LALLLALLAMVATPLAAGTKASETVQGYVLDSACAYTKNLDKPVSAECAKKCAAAGSPLVILAADGTVYWPIDSATPAKGQNAKLAPFAGQKVTVTGKVYERKGSKAMVIEKIAAVK
jgi:predicted lipoprotein with Yx(FWY)xxD motif